MGQDSFAKIAAGLAAAVEEQVGELEGFALADRFRLKDTALVFVEPLGIAASLGPHPVHAFREGGFDFFLCDRRRLGREAQLGAVAFQQIKAEHLIDRGDQMPP